MTPAEFHFTTDDIPEYSRKIIACATVDALERFLQKPGAREMLDAETARRKAQSKEERGTA